MKNLTKVGLSLFTVILLAGLVFAMDYETYEPTKINGIEILTSEPDTTVSERITEDIINDEYYRISIQKDICEIAQNCLTIDGNVYVKYEEFEEFKEKVKANDDNIVLAINSLYTQIKTLESKLETLKSLEN